MFSFTIVDFWEIGSITILHPTAKRKKIIYMTPSYVLFTFNSNEKHHVKVIQAINKQKNN